MKFFGLILLPLLIFARINPFKPVINPQNTIIVKPKYFTKAIIYPPKNARILKKIVFVYQTLSGDDINQTIKIDKDVDFHSPIKITHNPLKFSLKEFNFPMFKIYIKNRKFLINTKDKLLRVFFLAKPFRLVFDFKGKSNFLTITKNVKNSYIKKIVVGAHGDFYRIVIYFDAKYMYKVKKEDEGILVELY